MIVDILNEILNYSNLTNQKRITQIDKNSHDNLYIYSLNVPIFMSQKILEHKIFSRLTKLRCHGNYGIYDVGHLCNTLKMLECCECAIDQNGISKLKYLEIIICRKNKKIKDVNHLADTLIELDCGCRCGIDQNGIAQLKYLKKIDCFQNKKIKNVNHLANTLKELGCDWECGIDQNGIS